MVVTLADCDREPIHVPGAIQPHGVLFACDVATLDVLQVSANVGAFLGLEPAAVLGRSLLEILTPEPGASFATTDALATPRELRAFRVTRTSPPGTPFVAVVHRAAPDVLVVELEADEVGPRGFDPRLRGAIARLHATRSLDELYAASAEEVRTLTGFDRVMVYRFDAAWNGEVVAEAKREDLGTFLGHNYPAGDIPAQARRLYTLNWLRFIRDRDYVPAPLVPVTNPRTGDALDMSFSVLRSVSPIHCEYLRNMGVVASMSVSLLVDGALYGMIACHHYAGPLLVPYAARDTCEFLGQTLSWHVSSRLRATHAEHEAAAQRKESALLESMTGARNFVDGLLRQDLLELTAAAGAAVVFESAIRTLGVVPPEPELRAVAEYAARKMVHGVFATDRLGEDFARGAPIADVASGVLAVAISQRDGDQVLWFRPSRDRSVAWAGKVDRTEDGPPAHRLTPRGSFDVWREEVRGRSLPWQAWEVLAASNLRRSILGGVRRHAQELRRLATELECADRAKDVFIAQVSHELRTPLNAIQGWAYVLRTNPTDEVRRAHAVEVIERNVKAQSQLVEDLIDVSRIVSGKLAMEVTPVDLPTLVERAVESVSLAAESKGILLGKVLDSQATPVLGDAARLQQVVWNLLTNAIKFTPKGGKVEIVLRRLPSDVELVVRDNGQGIDAAFLPHVFELFRQAEEDALGARRGLGLGLAIVRHIVELHGGRTTAQSEGTGKGSSFVVRLPMSPLRAQAAPASPSSLPSPAAPALRDLEGVRLCIVEDEEDAREFLTALLRDRGADVVAFGDARAALDGIGGSGLPDAIVSDIGLPGMSGYEFVKALRARPEPQGGLVPAIALSAYTRAKERTQALLAGYQAHVGKPVDLDELIAVVRSLLGRRKPV